MHFQNTKTPGHHPVRRGWPGNFCCPTYKPTAFVCRAATAVSSTHNRSGKNHPDIRRSTEKPEEGIARRQAEIFCFLSWKGKSLRAVALYGNRAVFDQLNEQLTNLRIKLGTQISPDLRDGILHRHWLLVAPA